MSDLTVAEAAMLDLQRERQAMAKRAATFGKPDPTVEEITDYDRRRFGQAVRLWRVVPVEPTEMMVQAGGGALKAYIDALPDEERAKLKPRKTAKSDNAGYRIRPDIKCSVRWAAMLKAAPSP